MADDRMKNDDLDKNLGGKGSQGGKHGQQSPGRHKEDDEPFGQRGGGQGAKGRGEDQNVGGQHSGGSMDKSGQAGSVGNPGGRQSGSKR